jgi:chitin disaccharide deacetylase
LASHLVVNADDLGLSAGVNRGILEAHERGIVTSTSLMVRRPYAVAAREIAARCPSLSIGLHLEPAGGAAEAECASQLGSFRDLLGRDPTHIDSHHHVHMSEPLASAARAMAEELDVPLRGDRIRYEGGFFGRTKEGEPWLEGISVEHLIAIVEDLPPGWTELGCHPGVGVEAESSYAWEREHELRTLCDPQVRAALETSGVVLSAFSQLD